MSSAIRSVPPEIWLEIFSHTAWVPGLYTTVEGQAIIAFSRNCSGLQDCLRVVMKTKLAISLVSASWNVLGQKTLFEHLVIRSGEQALYLAALISSPAGSNIRGPGRWTIRLDIAVPYNPLQQWTSRHTCAIIEIVQSCPNLVCFADLNPANHKLYCTQSFIDALARSGKLKRLELQTCLPLLKILMGALAGSLEVLVLSNGFRSTSEQPGAWACTLPHLRVLVSTSDCTHITDDLHLPALQALAMDTNPIPLLWKHGQFLRCLSLTTVDSMFPSLALCPNLETLLIDSRHIAAVAFDRLKTLKELPIQSLVLCNAPSIDPPWWPVHRGEQYERWIRSILSDLISPVIFPVLRNVRLGFPFCSWAMFRRDQPRVVWREWLKECRHRGIRVELSEGGRELAADEWRLFSDTLV